MIALWCGLAARAADVGAEADLQFQLGVRDYEAGDLLDALGHLLQSYRLAPNRNVQFNLARVYEELGQLDPAWRHYHEYVEGSADRTARADGEAALARIEPRVARVRVVTTPPGADVYVGRKDLGPRGRTPLTLALPPGPQTLLLALDGHAPAEVTAALATGREVVADAALAPSAAGPAAPSFRAVVRAGPEVLVSASSEACALLPGRVSGAGQPRPAGGSTPVLPGSALAAQAPPPPLALDVTLGGVTARTPLARAERSPVLEDPSALRPWVFDRCLPTDGQGGLAAGLAALAPATRAEAVAVFAEWAADRGAPDVARAAASCLADDCAPLVRALLAR